MAASNVVVGVSSVTALQLSHLMNACHEGRFDSGTMQAFLDRSNPVGTPPTCLAPSPGQFKDFFRQIGDGAIRGSHIDAVLRGINPFEYGIGRYQQLLSWKAFHREIFGIEVDVAVVPPPPSDKSRLVVVPKGLTLAAISEPRFKKLFISCIPTDERWYQLEHARQPDKTYCVWVTYPVLRAHKFQITLMEGLLYAMKQRDEVSKSQMINLRCAGTRSLRRNSTSRVHAASDQTIAMVTWDDLKS